MFRTLALAGALAGLLLLPGWFQFTIGLTTEMAVAWVACGVTLANTVAVIDLGRSVNRHRKPPTDRKGRPLQR